jgi:outer membrane protein assembly factor BamB
VGASAAPEENWPQWRGPLQSGVAPLADPATTWSETNNVRWKVKIPGEGSATPLVWDNLVFVQTAIPSGKKPGEKPAEANEQSPGARSDSASGPNPGEPGRGPGRGGGRFGGGSKPTEAYDFAILCLERSTGKILWQQVAREAVPHEGVRQNEGTFASTSGLTDGKHVWAYFGSRGLYCYDLKGKLEWSQDLGKMKIAMGFGEGSSPTLYRNMLIVNWDNEDGSFITALDKSSGKTLWKEPREERTSWSTPLVIEKDGKAQVVVAATSKIRSYDAESGKLNWECGGLTRNVIPSPVADSEMVYCTSGFQGNALLAIHLGRSGDLTGTGAVAWTHKKSTPYVPSPLLYDGKIYFYANNNAVLSCVEARTGQVLVDAERIEGLQGVYASPLGAGGRVYLAGRNGATVVLKQSDKVEVLATNRLDDKFDASPAAAGKDLFLRGREYLYCIAEK